MVNFISFVILCFLLAGRRLAPARRKLHAWWMTAVIAADLILISYLVLGRSALDKVALPMPMALYIHLCFAITTVLLYLMAIFVGIQILSGHPRPGAMRGLDRVIVPCRILTLATSIWLQFAGT
jgi:hypothetical protein